MCCFTGEVEKVSGSSFFARARLEKAGAQIDEIENALAGKLPASYRRAARPDAERRGSS